MTSWSGIVWTSFSKTRSSPITSKRPDFSAVDMERMKKTSDIVTTAFKLPPVDVGTIYHPEFLPPKADLKLP